MKAYTPKPAQVRAPWWVAWRAEERRVTLLRVLATSNLVIYSALITAAICDEQLLACMLACVGIAVTAVTLYVYS